MKQKKVYFIHTTGKGIFKECRLVNFETKEVSEHYFTDESAVMDYASWWGLKIVPRPESFIPIVESPETYAYFEAEEIEFYNEIGIIPQQDNNVDKKK